MWEFFGALGSMLLNNLFGYFRENGARQENYQINEKAAQNADARTRALYNDISSPSAQKNQLQKAGLSPSLFYSGGVAGSSGMSGAMANGASGINPNVYGISAQEIANIKNIDADTELKQAEADKTKKEAGVVEDTAAAQITNLLADANAKGAQKAYTESQTAYQKTLNEIQSATSDAQIEKALHEAQLMEWQEIKTMYEADSAATDADTKKKIQDQVIQESINRNANLIADTALKQSQKQLNEQQKKNLQNDINVSLKNIEIQLKNAETQARQAVNARVANEIRDKARLDAFTMWKNDWELMTKKYELEKTDISYKYGKKSITHIGNQYSVITLDKTKTEPTNVK